MFRHWALLDIEIILYENFKKFFKKGEIFSFKHRLMYNRIGNKVCWKRRKTQIGSGKPSDCNPERIVVPCRRSALFRAKTAEKGGFPLNKILALILAFSMLFVCGCGPVSDESGETSSSADVLDTTASSEMTKSVQTTESDKTTETTETTETTSYYYVTEKPVIYLYPETETEITVKLDYKGEFYCTYPAYNGGWRVLASPDGTLTNLADGREYAYLFWDGFIDTEYDMSQGFVVEGEDTAAFLQDILARMGLTESEANDFIVYWLPRMQKNPYNLITFQSEAYTNTARLEISPKPDSVLRIFMVFQALEAPIEIEAPEIMPFERNGFTVIEWGGTEKPAY